VAEALAIQFGPLFTTLTMCISGVLVSVSPMFYKNAKKPFLSQMRS